jgi:hypothetical protein
MLRQLIHGVVNLHPRQPHGHPIRLRARHDFHIIILAHTWVLQCSKPVCTSLYTPLYLLIIAGQSQRDSHCELGGTWRTGSPCRGEHEVLHGTHELPLPLQRTQTNHHLLISIKSGREPLSHTQRLQTRLIRGQNHTKKIGVPSEGISRRESSLQSSVLVSATRPLLDFTASKMMCLSCAVPMQ